MDLDAGDALAATAPVFAFLAGGLAAAFLGAAAFFLAGACKEMKRRRASGNGQGCHLRTSTTKRGRVSHCCRNQATAGEASAPPTILTNKRIS